MDSRKENQKEPIAAQEAPVELAHASSGKPTQRTIASLTGLAVTTVSKALAGDEKIALKTRERVNRVAEEIGYAPDRAAQRLRTGRTHVIALVLDPHSEMIGFSASMIAGISQRLQKTPYHLVLMQHELGEAPINPIRRIVRNRLADGVIFARTSPQDDRVSYLLDKGFPFITHGRTELPAHPWVDYDNEAFASLAVKRLAATGKQHIALIAPSDEHMFARHLAKGFWSAIHAHGVRGMVPDDFDLHSSTELIRQRAAEHTTAPDAPDGWICPGEIAAMAVSAAIFDQNGGARHGTRIVGKRTSPAIDLLRPNIDLISEDLSETGYLLSDILVQKIENRSIARATKIVKPVQLWT